jgi:hypothetical protein
VALLAAVCACVAVSYRLSTSDVWQHLLVGKAIWALGRIPQEHLWTWPLFGTRDVLPSWGFAWLVWPFWKVGGLWGVQTWRWLTTLVAFGIGLMTARRLGARGLTPLFVIAVAALSYRARAQVRPETLVAVLIALQIWTLERRRAPGRGAGGGALLLVAIAWVWANVHISYYLGLAITSIHLLAGPSAERETEADGSRFAWLARLDRAPLAVVLGACVLVSFANPFDWRALWQPFEYFFTWRHEGVYQTIPELSPLLRTWPANLRSGLPFLVVAWPLLALGRALRRKFDPVESLTCALFVGHTLFNQRFSGALAVAQVPYLSRDLSELAGAVRLPASWTQPPARAGLVAVAMLLASVPGWTDRRFPPGVGIVDTVYPIAACDFIEQHGLAGRMFNPFYLGGYVLWRFWPLRDRLPFTDIHVSGTPEDRELYARVFVSPEAWNQLMQRHGFEMALLDGHQEWVLGDHLLDYLDADRGWALVFRDDAAALYVRRSGRLAAVAESLGYRVMPGGGERFAAMGESAIRDTLLRKALRKELERSAASSPLNAKALSYLANLDFLDGNRFAARQHLDACLAVDPNFNGAHRRIGYLCMTQSDWPGAIEQFRAERATGGPAVDEYQRMGEAWEKLGDRKRAAEAYRKEIDIHAGNDAARDALRRVSGE